jgi:hypothetical protein
MNCFSINGSNSCREAPYAQHIRENLQSSSGYIRETYEVILQLYEDLHRARRPHKHRVKVTSSKNVTTMEVEIYPFSFSIPEHYILGHVPTKSKSFGRVIPGIRSTYFDIAQEQNYRADMSASYFSVTYRKAGWDCLRHLEILSAGSMPLFLDIAKCPRNSLLAHPKRLYKQLLGFPGLAYDAVRSGPHTFHIKNLSFSVDRSNQQLYFTVASALMHYTRATLTTKAMAGYILDTVYRRLAGSNNVATSIDSSAVGLSSKNDSTTTTTTIGSSSPPSTTTTVATVGGSSSLPSSAVVPSFATDNTTDHIGNTKKSLGHNRMAERQILFLTHRGVGMDEGLEFGDYAIDTLLHGLKTIYGPNVHDFPRRDILFMKSEYLNVTQNIRQRSKYYGGGFSVSHQIDGFDEASSRHDESEILRNLKEQKYELVIIGSGHRGDAGMKSLPLWEYVCKFQPRERVVIVEGGDYPMTENMVSRYARCANYYFSREGLVSSHKH